MRMLAATAGAICTATAAFFRAGGTVGTTDACYAFLFRPNEICGHKPHNGENAEKKEVIHRMHSFIPFCSARIRP